MSDPNLKLSDILSDGRCVENIVRPVLLCTELYCTYSLLTV